MVDVHVVNVGLVKVDATGNIISDRQAIGARTQFSTEHRVIPKTTVPNSVNNPTIAEYLRLEALGNFLPVHIDQYTMVTALDDRLQLIANESTPGLLGVEDSLDYRVAEIERHLHNAELWYGRGAGNLAELNNLTTWTITTGAADTFGAPVQLASGTQFPAPAARFDIRRILVVSVSANNSTYLLEFYAGDGVFGDATLITSIPYRQANQSSIIPTEMISYRRPTSYNLWVRAKAQTATATIQIIFGAHFYAG